MVTWTRWCEYVWLVVASKQIKTGWKFLCFRTTCWTRSTMTHRHRFCQRNAEITTSLNQQCARKRMLRAAVISIHQPPRALHPLTASYIKIEMTSKDSIKIKKYKRRYMCKTCGCIQNTFWSPYKKKHHSESKTWVIAQNTTWNLQPGSDRDTVQSAPIKNRK